MPPTGTAVACLPMYDFRELRDANDAIWQRIAVGLTAAGVADVPPMLERNQSHTELWRHPRLLLAQACEYPLATEFAGIARLVATPRYGVAGCDGTSYRSAIVVGRDDGAASLADLQGRHCVINERNSNSGMNLLRAAIAPLANSRPFFAKVTVSGGHRQSAEAVANRRADIAAIDCVTFAHLGKFAPDITERLRVLCWTAASPSLPLITAEATDETIVAALRSALTDIIETPDLAAARNELYLEGFDYRPDQDLKIVRALADRAAALGYPSLS